jgi:GNAT superfamily N-acetyltransferase
MHILDRDATSFEIIKAIGTDGPLINNEDYLWRLLPPTGISNIQAFICVHRETKTVLGKIEYVAYPATGIGIIKLLYVRQQVQSRGLGTRLVNRVLDEMKELGIHIVEVAYRTPIVKVPQFYKQWNTHLVQNGKETDYGLVIVL